MLPSFFEYLKTSSPEEVLMLNNLKSKLLDPAQHYEVFLTVLMIFYVATILLAFKFVFEVVTIAPTVESYMNFYFITATLGGLFFAGVQIAAASYAKKFIRENNTFGFIITAALAVMFIPSVMFLIGLFGLYSILNSKFQSKFFLDNRPLWLVACYEQVAKWTSPQRV